MPALGIDVEIYYDTAPTTKVDVLNGRTSVSGLVELKNHGGGSFTIPKSDPKIRQNPQLLAYRNIVKLRVNGKIQAAFIIQNKKSVIVGKGEDAEESWEISGEGLRSWARDAIVYPSGALKSTAKETRYFNFASAPDSWLNPLWPNATRVRIWKGVTSNPWGTAPANWPDAPDVYWIWDRGQLPADGPAPLGKCYFRYAFIANHSSGFQKYAFFFAADNYADVYVDGELMMEAGDSTWHQTNRVDFELEPGIHVLGMEVTNISTYGGVIGALFKVGDASEPTAASLVATTGNNAFKVLAYPENEPGWTIGNVLYKLIPEAAARGVRFAQNITMTFTEEADSSGTPWPRGSFAFDIGTNYEDVFTALEELDCDIYLDPETLELHAWTVKGTDRSLTSNVTNPIVLRVGQTVTDATETGQAQLTNRTLIHSKDGWFQKTASAASLSKYGTVESQFSTELSSAASAKVANDLFKVKQDPEKSNTLIYEPINGLIPFVNFHIGDYVSAPINDRGSMESRKVVSISFVEGANGRVVYAVEFDNIFSDRMTLLEKGVTRASGASGATGGVANSSGKPSKTPTARPTPVYNNQPDAPNWINVYSAGRWDANGVATSDIALEWTPVTTSGMQTISDVEGYEVWGRRSVDTDMIRITRTTQATAILKGYEANSSWVFAVRALSRTSGAGKFSVDRAHTTATPPDPLGAPSAPGLATGRGTVIIAWNGNIAGVPAPPSFKFMTLERRLTSGTTWKKVASFSSGGTVDADVVVGTSYTYRLFATDTLGVQGAYSPSATITVAGVGMVDLDQLVKDEVQAAKDAANAAQTSANGKNKIYYTTTQPTAPSGGHVVGDTWFDSDDGFKMYTWTGSAWQVTQDSAAAAALANTKNRTFIQSTAPTAIATGDLWIDTANGNQLKRWSGSAWVTARDTTIADAAQAAQNAANAASAAQTSADGKSKVYYQGTAPTAPTGGHKVGDTWFDTANDYKIMRWSGSAWVASLLGDKAIGYIDAATITSGYINAGRIAANTITGNMIAANTITANEMVAGTITAASGILADAVITTAKIADLAVTNAKISTLDAGKITTGFLDAGRIQVGSLAANRIAVWDFTNMLPGGEFDSVEDLNNWFRGSDSWNSISTTSTYSDGSAGSLYVPGNPTGGRSISQSIPVKAGQIFKFTWSVRVGSTYNGTLQNGKIRIGDLSGTPTNTTSIGDIITAWEYRDGGTGTGQYRITKTFTVPAGITKISVALVFDHTEGNLWLAGITMREMNAAELIVDGGIKANHIEAAAITTDKLAAGAITADKIQSGTITSWLLDINARPAIGSEVNRVPAPLKDNTYWSRVINNTINLGPVSNVSSSSLGILMTPPSGANSSRLQVTGSNPVPPSRQVHVLWKTTGATARVVVYWRDGTTYISSSTSAIASEGSFIANAPDSAANYDVSISDGDGTNVRVAICQVFEVIGTGGTAQKVEISPAGLKLYNADGDQVISLGTDSDDLLSISKKNSLGESVTVATIDSDGNGSFQGLDVSYDATFQGATLVGDFGDSQTNGSDLRDIAMFDRLARGVVAVGVIGGGGWSNVTHRRAGLASFQVDLRAGRVYRFEFYGNLVAEWTANGSSGSMNMDVDWSTNTQSISSPQTTNGGTSSARILNSGADTGADFTYPYIAFREFFVTSDDTYNVLVSLDNPAQRQYSLFPGDYSSNPARIELVDLMPIQAWSGGGTEPLDDYSTRAYVAATGSSSGSTTPTAPKRYTKTWNATWSVLWGPSGSIRPSGGSIYDDGRMLQGGYTGSRCSRVGFPALGISGRKISGAWLRVKVRSTGTSSGATIKIGTHGNTSETTGSAPNLSNQFTKKVVKGQDLWIPIPSSLWASIASGSIRGFQIGGPNVNSGNKSDYVQLDGYSTTNAATSSGVRPQLRVTYQ